MKEFKRDKKGQVMDKEHFRNMFKNRIGSPDRYTEVDKKILEKFQGILPDELLMYWKEYGFSSFKDGLMWLTNPDDYSDLVKAYLKGTQFENRTDLYAVARNAFGQLYLWESSKGNIMDISSFSHMIFFDAVIDRNDLNKEEEEYYMNRFLSFSPKHLDEDDGSENPLFERALKKLGKVESNEMYGYKLSDFLGGQESIRNLGKMDLFVHYSIQKQMKEPTISISDSENKTLTLG